MDKLSKETFRLLSIVYSYNEVYVSAVLQRFSKNGKVTRQRINELKARGFIVELTLTGMLKIEPAGIKYVEDVLDAAEEVKQADKLSLKRDVGLIVLGALLTKLLEYIF